MLYILLINFVLDTICRSYSDQSYNEIVQRWTTFQEQYPHLIKIKENFELNEDQLIVQCGDAPCKYFYAEVTDFSTGYAHKPTVLMVGGFHGDERLGPNVITELADTLLRNANTTPIQQYLRDKLIILMPMVNPSGYLRNMRFESQHNKTVDINRDFSYDNPKGLCFQSKGARAVANLYKKYVILAGITFHGGDNVISWPWGCKNHLKSQGKSSQSPDDRLFTELGSIMYSLSQGNAFLGIPAYKVGSMTDTVYPLEGAYEDWAYAAGWETEAVNKQCLNVPTTFNDGLQYNERTLMFLVEASYRKDPSNPTYGNSESTDLGLQVWPPFFYNKQALIDDNLSLKQGYGHINRNILLSLGAIDMIQPYIIYAEGGIRFGGCINVDQLDIFENDIKTRHLKDIQGIWSNPETIFYLNTSLANKVSISFVCDQAFLKQDKPDPDLKPQSFLLQSRFNDNFQAKAYLNEPILNRTFYFALDSNQLKQMEGESQQDLIREKTNLSHMYLLLALMFILALILSFIFYKFCQDTDVAEDQVEMVQSTQMDLEPGM